MTRSAELRAVYGLVLATLALAVVVCVSVNSIESRTAMEVELFQQPADATMLKTDHYVAPNPLEDPELAPKYDVDTGKETTKSKADFQKARDEVKKGMGIMKDVLKKLTKQDEDRDKLMDEAIGISDRIHSVRHLLISVKSEAERIQTKEDGDWIFTNPFGKAADPPQQELSPFETQVKDLTGKTKKINSDLKDLIKKCHSTRNNALVLDSELYDEIHKAKVIAADAVVDIHHHFDRVEMFNHKDFDIVHRVDAKLNDKFRVDRHRLHGLFNLAQAMSDRQPNEVSEVTALATDLLIVNAEAQERLERMQKKIDDIKYDRTSRTK
jgi:hypothetical protein